MTRLFVNIYTDKNSERNFELIECLDANKDSFDEVICIHGRPTFKDYFDKINEVAEEDDVSVIANLDIIFLEDALTLIKKHLLSDDCYALSRWDVGRHGGVILFDREDSQDAWCFRGKVKDVMNIDFTLGVPGVDNAIAERLFHAGYTVLNPSRDIEILHLHITNIRNYDRSNVVNPPYLLVRPHHLHEKPIYRRV